MHFRRLVGIQRILQWNCRPRLSERLARRPNPTARDIAFLKEGAGVMFLENLILTSMTGLIPNNNKEPVTFGGRIFHAVLEVGNAFDGR
jgi:hypothetical protein